MPDSKPSNKPTWEFRTTKAFWQAFDKLDESKQAISREKFKAFREDPFHDSLRTHMIHRLSALYKKKIYTVCLDNDLRAVFFVEGNVVTSVGIGSHKIYG